MALCRKMVAAITRRGHVCKYVGVGVGWGKGYKRVIVPIRRLLTTTR